MKYLLHCIFRGSTGFSLCNSAPELLVLKADGLAVAMTPWSDEEPYDNVGRLLAYEKAIARMHATRTVIPLRFGCVVDGESEVLRLLREHHAEYEQLLAQWEGLTEMGLRLWSGSRPGAGTLAGVPGSTAAAQYLAALRERTPGLTPTERQCAARIAELLSGLVRAGREEAGPVAGGRLVSLYCLVPRTAVDDFRERARAIDLPAEMKLLVSGPWPPYNFASPSPS